MPEEFLRVSSEGNGLYVSGDYIPMGGALSENSFYKASTFEGWLEDNCHHPECCGKQSACGCGCGGCNCGYGSIRHRLIRLSPKARELVLACWSGSRPNVPTVAPFFMRAAVHDRGEDDRPAGYPL